MNRSLDPQSRTQTSPIQYNLLVLPEVETESKNENNGDSAPKANHRSSSPELVFFRHTHYDPFQVAVEDELEAWARHASASNGFGSP